METALRGAAVLATVGAGGRIAGIAVGIDRPCIGIQGLTRAVSVAVPRGGGGGRLVASGRRVAGVFLIVSCAGNRAQHDRGQDQRG